MFNFAISTEKDPATRKNQDQCLQSAVLMWHLHAALLDSNILCCVSCMVLGVSSGIVAAPRSRSLAAGFSIRVE